MLVAHTRFEKVPEKKRQVVVEMFVNFVNNMVKENMGVKMMKYAPYIATLLIYAVFGALISMIGLRSMTADINVTATWALMTFVLITYNKIKANGFKGYLKSFAQPVAFILPLNIIGEVATPASMAFRLFGNVAGGMVITGLLYGALGSLSSALGLTFEAGSWAFSVFQVGIPGGAQRVFRPVFRVHTGLYLLHAHHGKRWCGCGNRVIYRFGGKYKKVNSK